MFSYVHPKNFGGHHIPTGMSTSKPWSISNTCKNGKAAKEMQSLEKVHLVGQNESLQLFVSGTKFTIFFAQHQRGCIWSLVAPIFVLSICSGDICDQIEGYQKSREILYVFALSHFVGSESSKGSTQIISNVAWKCFVSLLLPDPKL